jgi:hypothetical protein
MPYPSTRKNVQAQSTANAVVSVVSDKAGPNGLVRCQNIHVSFATNPASQVVVSAYESIDGVALSTLLYSIHVSASNPFPLNMTLSTKTKNKYMILQVAAAGVAVVTFLNATFDVEDMT